jgi:hypothetical protein
MLINSGELPPVMVRVAEVVPSVAQAPTDTAMEAEVWPLFTVWLCGETLSQSWSLLIWKVPPVLPSFLRVKLWADGAA